MKKYKIYKITLKGTDRCYIGFTRDEKKRWRQHIEGHKSGNAHAAIKKFGQDNFAFEVIDSTDCAFEAQYVLEPYYIGMYRSDDLGFNGRLCSARPMYYGVMKKAFMAYFTKKVVPKSKKRKWCVKQQSVVKEERVF